MNKEVRDFHGKDSNCDRILDSHVLDSCRQLRLVSCIGPFTQFSPLKTSCLIPWIGIDPKPLPGSTECLLSQDSTQKFLLIPICVHS